MTDSTPTVTRNEEKSRYEIHVGDVLAGFARFEVDEHGRHVYPHTEIDHAFGGRGLGSVLVGEALADEARRGQTVVPVCPFVVKYIHGNEIPGLEVAWRPTADEGGSETIDSTD